MKGVKIKKYLILAQHYPLIGPVIPLRDLTTTSVSRTWREIHRGKGNLVNPGSTEEQNKGTWRRMVENKIKEEIKTTGRTERHVPKSCEIEIICCGPLSPEEEEEEEEEYEKKFQYINNLLHCTYS